MEEYVDPTPTRVDYMKFSVMMSIVEQINRVRQFVHDNPGKDAEVCIGQSMYVIDNLFEEKIGQDEFYAIVKLLRGFAQLVSLTSDTKYLDEVAGVLVDSICKIIQGTTNEGENVMGNGDVDNNKELFDRVIKLFTEALEMGQANANTGDAVDWSDTAKSYAEEARDLINGIDPLDDEFVDQYFEMDPETDDLLHNGTLVIDGMKVLVGSDGLRQAITENMDGWKLSEARKWNRWATVESSRLIDGNTNLAFIAHYEDGTKKKIVVNTNLAWYVKKNTIPRIDAVIGVEGVPIFWGTQEQVMRYLGGSSGVTSVINAFLSVVRVRVGDYDETVTAADYIEANGDANLLFNAPATEVNDTAYFRGQTMGVITRIISKALQDGYTINQVSRLVEMGADDIIRLLEGKAVSPTTPEPDKVFNDQGEIVWQDRSLTLMEEYLKANVTTEQYGTWKVQPASYSEPVTILQYLQNIGSDE